MDCLPPSTPLDGYDLDFVEAASSFKLSSDFDCSNELLRLQQGLYDFEAMRRAFTTGPAALRSTPSIIENKVLMLELVKSLCPEIPVMEKHYMAVAKDFRPAEYLRAAQRVAASGQGCVLKAANGTGSADVYVVSPENWKKHKWSVQTLMQAANDMVKRPAGCPRNLYVPPRSPPGVVLEQFCQKEFHELRAYVVWGKLYAADVLYQRDNCSPEDYKEAFWILGDGRHSETPIHTAVSAADHEQMKTAILSKFADVQRMSEHIAKSIGADWLRVDWFIPADPRENMAFNELAYPGSSPLAGRKNLAAKVIKLGHERRSGCRAHSPAELIVDFARYEQRLLPAAKAPAVPVSAMAAAPPTVLRQSTSTITLLSAAVPVVVAPPASARTAAAVVHAPPRRKVGTSWRVQAPQRRDGRFCRPSHTARAFNYVPSPRATIRVNNLSTAALHSRSTIPKTVPPPAMYRFA
eukprot:TRINITY_DN10665_c0_g1_i1.p1 TRINITY_DN10665_c0_g1~~TRINITY_DN10665_c0_g1_i1.p1  ORF type:complete len:465 (-),score=75.98 TRINITY_DN10665_c0_g1_i1:217-1611(-)